MKNILTTIISFISVLFFFQITQYSFASTNSFKVKVPNRSKKMDDLGEYKRGIMGIVIYTDIIISGSPSDNKVNLKIRSPEGDIAPFEIRDTPGTYYDQTFPSGVSRPDYIIVETLDADVIPSEVDWRIKINIILDSDADGCSNLMTDPNGETWEFIVEDDDSITIDMPLYSAACVLSYAREGIECRTWPPIPIATDDDAAIIDSTTIPSSTGCEGERPPVKVMLVLDKSGSMGWPSNDPKINHLRSAVQNFAGVWKAHRAEGDSIGIVLFNSSASDWTFSGTSPLNSDLNKLTEDLADAIGTKVNTITAGGSTSVGNGLIKAANYLKSSTNRKVILLMSDGKQNTSRLVAITQDVADIDQDGQTTDNIVVTHLYNGNDLQPLPNIENLDIWTVGIGTCTDIDATIFDEIAGTGVGFYLNSHDAADQNLFFLKLLQNFLRFNTIETTQLISSEIQLNSGLGSAELKVPTSSTAKKITFNLMWNPESHVTVKMEVIAPDSVRFDKSNFEQGSGFIRFTTPLPHLQQISKVGHIGDWQINIVVRGGSNTSFLYQFYAFADDDVIKSKFEIEKMDYVTGDPIPLLVSLKEFGLPITNPNGDLKVIATLIKPGEGIGNLLAESNIAGSTQSTSDPQSAAQQKMDSLLKANPNAIKRSSEVISLFDDGTHGDRDANDGIYGYVYHDDNVQGHYNFLFAVNGPTQHTGPISRQHIETVYVRIKPDMNKSDVSAQEIFEVDPKEGVTERWLYITLIPRDKFGNMVGPGYQNYFVINPLIHGHRAKFTNINTDGIYKTSVRLNDTDPVPKINIQFVRPLIVVTDEMDPANIPADLIYTFITKVKVKTIGKYNKYLSFHAGLNVPGSNFDGNLSMSVDYEQRIKNRLSLLLFGSYNMFANTSGNDLKVYSAYLNGKYYLSDKKLSLFINAGGSYNWYDTGGNVPGYNAGGGLHFSLLQSRMGLELWYNYHNIPNSILISEFLSIQLGFNIGF